jgi:AbiU2
MTYTAPTNESEYWHQYQIINGDIELAIRCFHTELEFHQLARENKEIYDSINKHALFWNTLLYSLQSAFFISLSRVFDDKPDTHTIHKLLSETIKHPEFFTRTALAARKKSNMYSGGLEWLENYLLGVWEPTPSELGAIKTRLKPFTAKFKENYKPIRNQIFAHRITIDGAIVSELFDKTLTTEIDQLLYFLFNLMQNLRQLFHNGLRSDWDAKSSYDLHVEEVRISTKNVIRSISPTEIATRT